MDGGLGGGDVGALSGDFLRQRPGLGFGQPRLGGGAGPRRVVHGGFGFHQRPLGDGPFPDRLAGALEVVVGFLLAGLGGAQFGLTAGDDFAPGAGFQPRQLAARLRQLRLGAGQRQFLIGIVQHGQERAGGDAVAGLHPDILHDPAGLGADGRLLAGFDLADQQHRADAGSLGQRHGLDRTGRRRLHCRRRLGWQHRRPPQRPGQQGDHGGHYAQQP